MVTLQDIANEAGVSRGTVDRVLHQRGQVDAAKEKRILEITERLGYRPNVAARGLAAQKKHITIGFLYVDQEGAPFQQLIYEGAKEYAKELEQKGVGTVFIPLKEDRPEAEIRAEALGELLKNQEFDGYAVMGTLAEDLKSALEKQGKSKVPIVVYYMEEQCDWRLCFVGCDFKQSGHLAAEVAALLTNGTGSICIVATDYRDLPSVTLRIEGFKEELDKKNLKMQIISSMISDGNLIDKKFIDCVEEELDAHPEIDLMFLVNPGDYHACEMLFEIAGKHNIRIITNDLITEKEKELVRRKGMAVSINHAPDKQGRKVLEMLYNYLALGIAPKEEWYKSELSIKLGNNI